MVVPSPGDCCTKVLAPAFDIRVLRVYFVYMKMKDIDLFIFDLDGTLIDSGPDIAASLQETYKKFSDLKISDEEILNHVGSGVAPLLKRISPPDVQKKAIEFFMDHYEKNCCNQTTFYPGMDQVFKTLNKDKTVICTNKPTRYTEVIFKNFQLHKYFKGVFCGDTFSERKPSKLPLIKICEKYSVNPDRALMIGDTNTDISAAFNANTKSCYVGYGYGKKSDLKHPPDYSVATASQLLELS